MRLSVSHQRQGWNIEDIRFGEIDKATVRDDEFLFLTLASASFVEILAETYSKNLIEHFRGDAGIVGWLTEFWQREEMQHGRALKTYVQTVWPEFDWEGTHRAFQAQYGTLCTVEQLEPHKALELMARCVVETGTSSFYRALQHYVCEPVLRQLLENIQSDETAHYTHFRRYFATYNAIERHGAGSVFAAVWRRLCDIRGEDAYIAFKHVYAGKYPNQVCIESAWRRYNRRVKRLARRHYPYLMAIKMLIKPLPIAEPFKRMLRWPLVALALLVSLG